MVSSGPGRPDKRCFSHKGYDLTESWKLRFEVLSASDGRAALTLIEDPDTVSIVVTDFHMPGADRLEVVEGSRERHPDLPVVVMTDRIDLLNEKAVKPPAAVLAKPFTMRELMATVKEGLNARLRMGWLGCLGTLACSDELDVDQGTSCPAGSV